MARVFILLGPPGAGKGTQAVRLSAALSLPHVSTGDLFRENLSKGTELGRSARKFMDKGELVPDDLVLDMLFDRVSRPDCKDGYLLDGFPRTVAQAEALDARLASARPGNSGGKVGLVVLNLQVPDSALIERLTGRRICRQCSNIHHLRTAPPRVSGKCDKCGGELYERTDDSAEVVRNRLDVYRRQTQPVEGYYQTRRLLQNIDGDRTADEVFQSLKSRAMDGAAA